MSNLPPSPPSTQANTSRKLKSHTKSRRGCGNCKLRKVKCDESRPQCQKCVSFGVSCNYDAPSSSLQPSAERALVLQHRPPSTSRAIVGTIQSSQLSVGNHFMYQIQEADLALLYKFQERTAFTISMGKQLQTYRAQTIPLSFRYPHLLHTLLAVTLTHDRHLSNSQFALSNPLEASHMQNAITLFSNALSTTASGTLSNLSAPERIAMWGTSALICLIAFAYLEARDYTEAWPLAPPSPLDLNWLGLNEGKKEILRIAPPPGEMDAQELFARPVENEVGYGTLPRAMLDMCGLLADERGGGQEDNPYAHAAATLAQALTLGQSEWQAIIIAFWKFVAHFEGVFKSLLGGKDEKALLILAWWYGKVCQVKHWWLLRRAKLEGLAICEFLDRRWRGSEEGLLGLLEWPRRMCEEAEP